MTVPDAATIRASLRSSVLHAEMSGTAPKVITLLTTTVYRTHFLRQVVGDLDKQSWRPDAVVVTFARAEWTALHRVPNGTVVGDAARRAAHARGDAAWLVQREPWLCVATTPQDLGPLQRVALILVRSHRFETCAGASNVTGIFEPGRNLNGTARSGNDVALVTLDDDFSYPPRVMATLIGGLRAYPHHVVGLRGIWLHHVSGGICGIHTLPAGIVGPRGSTLVREVEFLTQVGGAAAFLPTWRLLANGMATRSACIGQEPGYAFHDDLFIAATLRAQCVRLLRLPAGAEVVGKERMHGIAGLALTKNRNRSHAASVARHVFGCDGAPSACKSPAGASTTCRASRKSENPEHNPCAWNGLRERNGSKCG